MPSKGCCSFLEPCLPLEICMKRFLMSALYTKRLQVAIKLLPRGDFVKNYQLYVRREIQNQSSLRHPLIVSLREVYACPAPLEAFGCSFERLQDELSPL